MFISDLPRPRSTYAICTILSSWLLMQIFHETGHALCALSTGGKVRRIVLVPWELSRTDLIENQRPLLVCWAGPIIGVLFPMLMWLITRRFQWNAQFPLRFLTGFCLIANGAYIGYGSLTKDGDAGELIQYGSPMWLLWIFFIMTVPTGLCLWHGLGRFYGFGPGANVVDPRTARSSILILLIIVAIESVFAWI